MLAKLNLMFYDKMVITITYIYILFAIYCSYKYKLPSITTI